MADPQTACPHYSAVLHYSPREMDPADLLQFIEARPFTRRWGDLGLTDQDLRALQICIMANPKAMPVVKGTGGLRKGRFAPYTSDAGKSGGLRVCYAYFEEFGVVLLVVVYAKSEADDIPESHKPAYKRLLTEAEQLLSQRSYRSGRAGAE